MEQQYSNNYPNNQQAAVVADVQEKKGNSKITLVLLVLVCILTAFNTIMTFVIGNGRTAAEMHREQRLVNKYEKDVAKKAVELTDLEIDEQEYSTYVNCKIENKSKKDLTGVNVDLLCYDADDNYLGTDSIYISYLPKGETINVHDYLMYENTETLKVFTTTASYYNDLY